MFENAIVFLIVLLAGLYALWKFTPASLRTRAAPTIVGFGRHLGVSAELAVRLQSKLATGGACGSCNSCNACATDPNAAAPGEESLGSAPPARVIPIARDRS